jgi:hypothetical protein
MPTDQSLRHFGVERLEGERKRCRRRGWGPELERGKQAVKSPYAPVSAFRDLDVGALAAAKQGDLRKVGRALHAKGALPGVDEDQLGVDVGVISSAGWDDLERAGKAGCQTVERVWIDRGALGPHECQHALRSDSADKLGQSEGLGVVERSRHDEFVDGRAIELAHCLTCHTGLVRGRVPLNARGFPRSSAESTT